MSGSCAERRLALGAYVVGALDDADRAEVEDHLAECSECRAELASLAILPNALHLLRGAGGAIDPMGEGGPAGSVLERTMARLKRVRRRRRLRLRLVAAIAALSIAALGTTVAVLVASRPASSSSASAVLSLSGHDPGSGVTASVELYSQPWGASTHLRVSGVSPGDRCELVVVGRDGSQEVAATWSVGYSGAVELDGATGFAPGEISSLVIVTVSGVRLLTLQL